MMKNFKQLKLKKNYGLCLLLLMTWKVHNNGPGCRVAVAGPQQEEMRWSAVKAPLSILSSGPGSNQRRLLLAYLVHHHTKENAF